MEQQNSFGIMKSDNKQNQIQLQISIGIWNMAGSIPPQSYFKTFIHNLIKIQYPQNQRPSMVVIGAQQCTRSIFCSFFIQNKSRYQQIIKKFIQGYKLVQTHTMNALHIAILVKQQLVNNFTVQRKLKLKAGPCNMLSNKGSILVCCNLLGIRFLFVNCHLESHWNKIDRRNQILLKIKNQFVKQGLRYQNTQDQVFIFGDLNYRMNMIDSQYKNIMNMYKDKDLQQIQKQFILMFQNFDQLKNSKILQQQFLPFYQQGQINFPPTYKVSQYVQKNTFYNYKRIPGWTDRIFYKKNKTQNIQYNSMDKVYGCDHRPVYGRYKIIKQKCMTQYNQLVQVKSGRCQLI